MALFFNILDKESRVSVNDYVDAIEESRSASPIVDEDKIKEIGKISGSDALHDGIKAALDSGGIKTYQIRSMLRLYQNGHVSQAEIEDKLGI